MRVLSGGCESCSDYGCSNSCSFRDMTFCKDFFSKFFRKLGIKNLKYHLCSEALSGYCQELRVLLCIMTAQILIVFEIWRFLCISSKFLKKNLDVTKFQNFEISILLLESVRVLSAGLEAYLWIWMLKFL